MNEKAIQLRKLDRIRQFYEKELELHKAQVATQLAVVEDLRTQQKRLQNAIDASQQSMDASIVQRELGTHYVSVQQQQMATKQNELNDAESELENRKTQLRNQMKKIESMEKLIDRKSVALQYEVSRREQAEADERYLNSDFEGMKS